MRSEVPVPQQVEPTSFEAPQPVEPTTLESPQFTNLYEKPTEYTSEPVRNEAPVPQQIEPTSFKAPQITNPYEKPTESTFVPESTPVVKTPEDPSEPDKTTGYFNLNEMIKRYL